MDFESWLFAALFDGHRIFFVDSFAHINRHFGFTNMSLVLYTLSWVSGGGSAKSGRNLYYYNRTKIKGERKTIKKGEIEKLVFDRMKDYIATSGTVESVMAAALRNRLVGLPLIEEELPRIKSKIKELEKVIGKFSTSIRSAAISTSDNLLEIVSVIKSEQNKAKLELELAQDELLELEKKKAEVIERFKHQTLEDFIRKAGRHFDKISELEKKALIQAIIPEIVIREDNGVELYLNPDPKGTRAASVCHTGGKKVVLSSKWRGGRDSNPRPSP